MLVTGTHEATAAGRQHAVREERHRALDTWARLPYQYHGSGCTLASAIAAMLANGLALPEAVREAQDYTWHALEKAYRPGMGQHLPDRLFWARDDEAGGDEAADTVAADAADARRPMREARTEACRQRAAGARSRVAGLYAVTPDVTTPPCWSAR